MQDEVKANSSVPNLALTRPEAAEALGVRLIQSAASSPTDSL
jgi:hypothetical protein